MNINAGQGQRSSKPDQPVHCESELIHIFFEEFGFLCFVFFFYSNFNSRLFSSLAEHQIHFAEMLRSRGSINRETSGNLSPAGHFPNNLGSASQAQSCRRTVASKSPTNDKTMHKHKLMPGKTDAKSSCYIFHICTYQQTHGMKAAVVTSAIKNSCHYSNSL